MTALSLLITKNRKLKEKITVIFEKQIVDSYRAMMFARCDDTETVFYFSSDDFPGMNREKFTFKSSHGHKLKGNIYYRDGYREGRLVVFDHGFGSGHTAYMKEIDLLTRAGYRVLAYDHTGCMRSGGEGAMGLSQSLCDLNDCISAIKSSDELSGLDISVMGHSWGAFSTMNIAALHPEISHIVAFSGFVSVADMLATFFPGILRGYRRAVLKLERETNPDFVDFNAVETLSNSDVKALLIYSDNDVLCKKKHYNILKAGLGEAKNVTLMLEKRKGHNPNYTEDAVIYLKEFLRKRSKLADSKNLTDEKKQAFVSSFDWHRMTEQDETVWEKILAHLES